MQSRKRGGGLAIFVVTEGSRQTTRGIDLTGSILKICTRKKACLLLAGILGVCANCNGTHTGTLLQVEKEGYTYFAVVPFEAPLLHQVQSEFVGPEPALARQISQRIGEELKRSDVEPSWNHSGYDGLIPALLNDEADFVISVFAKTPERERQVAFSETYYTSELVAVINPARNDKIRPNTLGRAKIGVRAGTEVEQKVRAKYRDAEIIPIETLDGALLQLRSGDLDAVIDDRMMAAYALATITGVSHLEILPDLVVDSIECGVAVRQGEDTLLRLVNEAVRESKDKYQTWIDDQFSPGQLAAVLGRHRKRLELAQRANKPRRVVIRISKSSSSNFDIYRFANLNYVLRNESDGQSLTSSRINFEGRTGVSSVNVPPGRYSVTLTKFNTTFGTLLILPDDPLRIDVNIRLQANDRFTMTKAS